MSEVPLYSTLRARTALRSYSRPMYGPCGHLSGGACTNWVTEAAKIDRVRYKNGCRVESGPGGYLLVDLHLLSVSAYMPAALVL